MSLPEKYTLKLKQATIRTSNAKMLYKRNIVPLKGLEKEVLITYGGNTFYTKDVFQIYVAVSSKEQGGKVIYRGKDAVIVFIDEKRSYCTIEFENKSQKTIELTKCRMDADHLIPVHFDHYEELLQLFRNAKTWELLNVEFKYDVETFENQEFARWNRKKRRKITLRHAKGDTEFFYDDLSNQLKSQGYKITTI